MNGLFSAVIHKIEGLDRKKEFVFISVLSFAIVFGVTGGMGTLTSGFHLVDDHEFAEWVYQMQSHGRSIWWLIRDKVVSDFSIRYEPLYYSMRILGTGVFGINLAALSVLKALEIIACFIFLYYCGRLMRAGKIRSFLFAAVSLVGYQSAVWWKLGPQEAQCTLLFSMGFFCLLRWLRQGGKTWAVFSILFFLLMSNYKESFILLIPFIVCFVIYDIAVKIGPPNRTAAGKVCISSYLQKLFTGLRGKYWYVIWMTVMFAVLVGVIVFYVGVNDYGGGGLDPTISFSAYKEAFFGSMQGNLKWYRRAGILFIAILLTYWENVKRLWKEILLTAVFLLPQFVLFAQTGIHERYMLPSAIGFAFFFVIVIPGADILKHKRRAVYMAGIVLLLCANARAMLIEADYFRYRGESVTGVLETVREISEGEGGEVKILSCLSPNAEGNLTIKYCQLLQGYDNVYYWNEDDKKITKTFMYDIDEYTAEDYAEQDLKEMDVIVMYNPKDRHYCYQPSLELSGYEQVDCGTLTLWTKNEETLPE